MNKLIGLASAMVLFAACGQSTEDACNEYVEAYNTCATAYIEGLGLEDTGGYDLGDICSPYASNNNSTSTEYFNCLTDFYSADCSESIPTDYDCTL